MKLTPLVLLLLPLFASSQYKVTIIVDKIPAQTADKLYMAGNFNQWNPADPDASLTKNQQGKFVKEYNDVEAGFYEFKFTQGSNESMECKADGTELPSRQATINSDTVFHFTIVRWKNAKNFDDSEKTFKGPQIGNTTMLMPRIDLFLQRPKWM